jgi:hypothetical protein
MTLRKVAINALVALVTLVVTAVIGEAALRIKNWDQRNYIVEMWRYANELKEISPDLRLGHVHVPSVAARLQGTEVSINSLGMRGPEPNLTRPGVRKILLLGSSITLGWGVDEEKTVRGRLQHKLGGGFAVLNGGIGNYNLARSVANFRENWRATVKPDVVVVHYFLNDADYLPPSSANLLMRNSQFAVILWHLAEALRTRAFTPESLGDYYQRMYETDAHGYRDMVAALQELDRMAREDGFRVIFSIIPDIHQLENYQMGYIHEHMRTLVAPFGWQFIDFFERLQNFKGPELWTIPGDPHPNAVAHGIMAEQLAPYLR